MCETSQLNSMAASRHWK